MEVEFYLEKLPARLIAAGRTPRIVWTGRRGHYVFVHPVEEYVSPKHALEACKKYIREGHTGKFVPKASTTQLINLPKEFTNE
jgi:hypothetical protein